MAPMCRWTLIVSCYFAVWSCAVSAVAAEPSAAPVRVMSFNIRYGTAPDGENAWPKRRELLLDVIRQFDPDLLGLQEAVAFQLDELQAALPSYGQIGVGRDDGADGGEFSAILYRTARWRPRECGNFWFSETPDVPGSKTWGNNYSRMCTWAWFVERSATGAAGPGGSPRSLRLYNVHWDHESQPSREKSGAALAKRIADAGAESQAGVPAVAIGDFNAGASNPALSPFFAPPASLQDAYRLVRPRQPDEATFHGFQGSVAGERIDLVLISRGWRVRDAEIVRTSRQGRYPSDHYPVTAVLDWPAPTAVADDASAAASPASGLREPVPAPQDARSP